MFVRQANSANVNNANTVVQSGEIAPNPATQYTGIFAALTLFAVYATTVARGVTLWDAGEFLAAIHSLGIPHPPGTPLYIVVAKVWSFIFAPVSGFAISVNLFSAACTASAFGFFADLMNRWTRKSLPAYAGAVCAGLMSTVWLNATETEVYAFALLVSCVILWIANRAYETKDARWVLLAAFVCGLGWSLHLTTLLVVPAALYLVVRARIPKINYFAAIALALLGASAALFMIVRAQHDPFINQGNPSTWIAFWDVIQRSQYDVVAMWPRQAPPWLQLGNVLLYADWQFSLGLHYEPGPSWLRTSLTVLFAVFGIAGCLFHRRANRESWRALLILFVTGTLLVVIYLNLKAGPSFGYGILADSAPREARERDYFFILGFICWGIWAGYGAISLAQRSQFRQLQWVALVIVLSPVAWNWPVLQAERAQSAIVVESEARRMLDGVPPNAVFLAIGDNDTYPLWYLQEVHRYRTDVTIITIPLLGSQWYREEVARRYKLLDLASKRWIGFGPTLGELQDHAAAQLRPVVRSPLQRSDGL